MLALTEAQLLFHFMRGSASPQFTDETVPAYLFAQARKIEVQLAGPIATKLSRRKSKMGETGRDANGHYERLRLS